MSPGNLQIGCVNLTVKVAFGGDEWYIIYNSDNQWSKLEIFSNDKPIRCSKFYLKGISSKLKHASSKKYTQVKSESTPKDPIFWKQHHLGTGYNIPMVG